jgi:hypothetical protein
MLVDMYYRLEQRLSDKYDGGKIALKVPHKLTVFSELVGLIFHVAHYFSGANIGLWRCQEEVHGLRLCTAHRIEQPIGHVPAFVVASQVFE